MESNNFAAKAKRMTFKPQQDFRFFMESKWRKRITLKLLQCQMPDRSYLAGFDEMRCATSQLKGQRP